MDAPMKTVLRIALLSLICVSLLTQNSVNRTLAADQNSILNLYDAFGYQKRGTVLDWGFSALVRYNGKTILFDTGNSAIILSTTSRRSVWISTRLISPCSRTATLTTSPA